MLLCCYCMENSASISSLHWIGGRSCIFQELLLPFSQLICCQLVGWLHLLLIGFVFYWMRMFQNLKSPCNSLGLGWWLSLRSLPLEVRVIPAARRRFTWAKGCRWTWHVPRFLFLKHNKSGQERNTCSEPSMWNAAFWNDPKHCNFPTQRFPSGGSAGGEGAPGSFHHLSRGMWAGSLQNAAAMWAPSSALTLPGHTNVFSRNFHSANC